VTKRRMGEDAPKPTLAQEAKIARVRQQAVKLGVLFGMHWRSAGHGTRALFDLYDVHDPKVIFRLPMDRLLHILDHLRLELAEFGQGGGFRGRRQRIVGIIRRPRFENKDASVRRLFFMNINTDLAAAVIS
jgi:hypothetical protein